MIPIAKPFVGDEEKQAVLEVLESGHIAQGEKVAELEQLFCKLAQSKYAVATCNGTTALYTALHCLGIKKGDEVITTPFSFVSTGNCILMAGAKPVFADIKPDTFNIDPEDMKNKITDKTKAILPVDLYGQPYDYDAIQAITQEHNLLILEDAAQSIGANLGNKPAGSLGDAACFSLYGTKNITCGEGGIITTDSKDVYDKARLFRNHGQGEQYEYNELGYNFRLSDLHAAVAVEQMKKLDSFTDARINNAQLLTNGLKDVNGIIIPVVKDNCKHVFHQYTIRITDSFPVSRDELRDALFREGIHTGVYYPKPLHLQPAYKKLGYKKGDFPVAEKACEEVLSLPVHPLVSESDIKKIIDTINLVGKHA